MLALEEVSIALGAKTILDHFSLSLTGRVVLLGPSGCGKTTLLRVAAGLLPPDRGRVLTPPGLRASFVFQEDRLLPWRDALGNLTALGIPQDTALAALDAVGLTPDAHALPADLSGGMARRLAIARAIAFGGDFFFLDEPLRGLDAATAQPVLAALAAATQSRAALLITHNPAEALALGDVLLRVEGPPVTVAATARAADFQTPAALARWLQADRAHD